MSSVCGTDVSTKSDDNSVENTSHLDSEQNDQIQPLTLGNRLGGNGWSGWSSQFEEDEQDGGSEQHTSELPSQTSTQKEEFKSFDSLLKVYGNKTETLSTNETSQDDSDESLLPVNRELIEGNLRVCLVTFHSFSMYMYPLTIKLSGSELSLRTSQNAK